MAGMKVALDARITAGAGGVQQFIIGLASGLSLLTDGDEEYYFLTYRGEDSWLRPYLGGRCRVLSVERPLKSRLRTHAERLSPTLEAVLKLRQLRPWRPEKSEGVIEWAGVDVVHFPTQRAFLTDVPSIYQPHDLQHVHRPEFFDPRERTRREASYREYCKRARYVVMMTSWGKRDVIHQYGLSDESVIVIPGAPILTTYEPTGIPERPAVDAGLSLPKRFLFYPARPWAHKNHLGLIEALAIVRDRYGEKIFLVCSGKQTPLQTSIEKRVSQLRLGTQVRFLGFVAPSVIVNLYQTCTGMVFPTMFEGWGFPICEAFCAGVPVACSDVTSLPDLTGDAALLFDPNDPEAIAKAVYQLWTDEGLRRDLSMKGKQRASLFSWENSARMFRALYRKTAGHPCTEEDKTFLTEPALV